MAAPDLQPDYYWRNLCTVVQTVRANNAALLTPVEEGLFDKWAALPRQAQLLHSRLLMRRGPDFRRSRLRYDEVGDLDVALDHLHAARLVTVDPPLTLEERVAVFTVPELRAVAAGLGLDVRGRRADVVESLSMLDPAAVQAALAELDPIVRRHGCSAFSRAQVIFFGNRQQDMSAFVRAALDQVRYADYEIDRGHPLFPDREALDAYLAAGARWDDAFSARMADDDAALVALGAEAANDLLRRPPIAPFRARVDPARADSRVIYRAARAHERRGEAKEAIALYRLLVDTRRHIPTAARAADRLGLIRRRAGGADGFAARVADLLSEPTLDGPSRRTIRRRLRLLKQAPDPRVEEPEVPQRTFVLRHVGHTHTKALYAGPDGQPLTVEEAVLACLGGDGLWCEGGLYSTLFGVLLWDVIFASVPGAFQHAFQDAPVDFSSPLFFLRREARFLARFAALREMDLAAEVRRAAAVHQGVACRGVDWGRFDVDVLARVAGSLGEGLLAILGRLARHPGRHRAGLPDLLVWTEEGVQLAEVKGPGDQVSVEQGLWHAHLLRNGVPFFLARVKRS